MKRPEPAVILRRAIRIEQHPKHPLYLFTLTASELLRVADVSRVSRDPAGELLGYQRPEVKRHVRRHRRVPQRRQVLFPNSIILALVLERPFSSSPRPGGATTAWPRPARCEIPLPSRARRSPAWIVDGQQRALALSKCKRQRLPRPGQRLRGRRGGAAARPVPARQQHQAPAARPHHRVAARGLHARCPATWRPGRRPAALCDLLNRTRSRRSRASSAAPRDAGARKRGRRDRHRRGEDARGEPLVPSRLPVPLPQHRHGRDGLRRICAELLVAYWSAVRDVFPEAWGRPPTESRLMHGAGIRAMGRLMDKVMGSIDLHGARAPPAGRGANWPASRPICRWTDGHWENSAAALERGPEHAAAHPPALERPDSRLPATEGRSA